MGAGPPYRTALESRVQFESSITSGEIASLREDGSVTVLQTDGPVDAASWRRLDEELFSARPDIQLRIYGHRSQVCDLSFLETMTSVRSFSADCLSRATAVEAIARLPRLKSLTVGIEGLEGFEFLEKVPDSLEELGLHRTRSRKPGLRHLERFPALQRLLIEGHTRSIEVVSRLESLQQLTLRSISTTDVEYLRHLPRLRSLAIKLGGIRDLGALAGNGSIEHLELWRIRGLSSIDFVPSMKALQSLFLQDLPRLTALPLLGEARKLKRVRLENMKGLERLDPLGEAPALEEFVFASAGHLRPEDLEPVLRNPSLKSASAGFGSTKRNDRFRTLMREHGIKEP